QLDEPVVARGHLGVAEFEDHLDHGRVLRQYRGAEAPDALFAGAGGQIAQRGAKPAALPVVGHRDGDLRHRRVLARAHEGRYAEAVARLGVERQQRLVVVVIDLRQVLQLRPAQLRLRGQEAAVARLGAEALKAFQQTLAVLRPYRTHEHLLTGLQRSSPGHLRPPIALIPSRELSKPSHSGPLRLSAAAPPSIERDKAPTPQAMSQEEHELKQLPILAVDDDAATLLLLARMLE